MNLKPGDQAPAFELKSQDGKTVKLGDFKGKKLLLYFYPKADTPGCTDQSCAIRDAKSQFLGLDVAVLGVSPDPEKKQAAFDAKHSLGFPLLADTEHAAAEAYGVWGEKSMYGKTYMGIIRSAFLIGGDGKIVAAWYKVSPADTVPNVLKALGV